MPNKTKNYNLTKPLPEEIYNIEDHNGNMDIIDTQLKNRADEITNVRSQIKSNTDAIESNTNAIKSNSDAITKIKDIINTPSVSDVITTVTLSKTAWDNTNKTQNVTVAGISEQENDQIIQVSPSCSSIANVAAYKNSSITAISSDKNSITFSAEMIPTEDIIVLISFKNLDSETKTEVLEDCIVKMIIERA